jgi:photosystem II stability/assembly factor-like uncharacterized protein
MGIQVSTNFDLASSVPLDSRIVVSNQTERNALVTSNKAYAGIIVYVTGENKHYYYNTGNQWVEFNSVAPSNVVYTTGNQLISGIKNITNEPSGGGSFSAGNILIGQNNNSLYLGRTRIEENPWDLKTSTIGTGWELALPAANTSGTNKIYNAIAISSKGNLIATSIQYTQNSISKNSIINISEDYGKTWSTKFELGLSSTRSPNILSIAMSVDGKFITIGAVLSSPTESRLFVSTDYGNTWVNRLNTFSVGAPYVSMSSDGRIQTAVQYNGNIYVSTDYGNTWVQKTFDSIGSIKWNGISMSSDGRIQAACRDSQSLAVSYDYGNFWTNKDTSRAWRSIKMSNDGRIQVAVTTVGGIFAKSIDYGQNWQIINNTTSAFDMANSSNGKILLFAALSSLYTSNNYGDTIINSPLPAAGLSYSVGMSSDGRVQCIGVNDFGIYISKASLTTQSNVESEGNIIAEEFYGNNLVYNTGEQTISGTKNFISRPTVNGTGVLLQGEAADVSLNNVVYTTGDQNISGIKSFERIQIIPSLEINTVPYFTSEDNQDGTDSLVIKASNNQPIVYFSQFGPSNVLVSLLGTVSFENRPNVQGTGVLLSGEAVRSNGTINNMIKLTQAEYNALSVKDPATFYVIVD